MSYSFIFHLIESGQKTGTITARGKDAARYRQKYLDPHVGSGEHTHTMAADHGDIEKGSKVKLHKVEVKDGTTHVHVEDEHGHKAVIPSNKLHKVGTSSSNAGHDFESSLVDRLKKHGLMDKNAEGAGSTAGTDFHLIDKKKNVKHSGKARKPLSELNGETKKDHTAAWGQVSIEHSKEKGWHVPDSARAGRPEFSKHVESHVIPHLNKHYPHGTDSMETTPSGRKKSVTLHHDSLAPAEAYLHDHHADILHVGGGKGTYSVGKDKTGLGLPRISGHGLWTARDKHRKKNSLTVQFQPHGTKGLKSSHFNLENDDHIEAAKKALGHK